MTALRRLLVVSLLIGLSLPARAEDQSLDALLKKGPVVLIEWDDEGRFKQATGVIAVDRPASVAWALATDFAAFKDFLPKVLLSEVEMLPDAADGRRQADVTIRIDAPGPDPKYTFRYLLDDSKLEMKAHWVKGDLKGSHASWRIVPQGPDRALAYYTNASKNFSRFAQAIEDDQQTITVGINVSAVIATLKALKRRVESVAPSAALEGAD